MDTVTQPNAKIGQNEEQRIKRKKRSLFLVSDVRKREFYCNNINSSAAIHIAAFLECNYFLLCFSEQPLQDWSEHSIWLTCYFIEGDLHIEMMLFTFSYEEQNLKSGLD